MKFSLALLLSQVAVGSAFSLATPAATSTTAATAARSTTSALGLFGGGGDKGGAGGDKKGPGMMDQLAMFKKAQEMASKKQKLDEELKKMNYEGVVEGKVTATFKYVPIANPMDPNPDYEATKFDFDDAFFESATPDEIAAAVKEAIKNGIEVTNKAVAEKYQVLQQDLMEAFGQK